MGKIKRQLALKDLNPRCVTPNHLYMDLCEDVHIHYRNIRFDMTVKEWALFIAMLNQIQVAADQVMTQTKYQEGDPNFMMQIMPKNTLCADSEYFPNRLSIEWQEGNTIHIHYRDLRLDLDFNEFLIFAKAMGEAVANLTKPNAFEAVKDITEPALIKVAVDEIQPYDNGHRPGEMNKEHREGIEICKKLIADGKRIRPILITKDGIIIDGHKRYWAQKESGLKEIEAIVDPDWVITLGKDKMMYILGGQFRMPFDIQEGEIDHYRIPCPFCKKEHRFLVTIGGSGYSFCKECNIFYTEWKNIELSTYNKNYLKRYINYEKNQHYYDYAFDTFMPAIDKLTEGKRGSFMDLGFIYPQILDRARKAGFTVTAGIDINPSCKEVEHGHKLYIGNFESDDLQVKEQYDVVWASHIFEHFKDPLKMISKTADMLKKGGVLFLAMPDPMSINPSALGAWGHWHIAEHHIIFPLDRIKKDLEDRGFEIKYAEHNNDSRFICIGDYHILAVKK